MKHEFGPFTSHKISLVPSLLSIEDSLSSTFTSSLCTWIQLGTLHFIEYKFMGVIEGNFVKHV